MALVVRPIELKDANRFVADLHRHHKPVLSHRFSLSCWNEQLRGVAICGRPVARLTNKLEVLEVTRVCTDGTKNACSILYAAAARAANAIGYRKIQTFLLEDEPGTSLLAAGWVKEADTDGGTWVREGRPRRTDQPMGPKQRWAKVFT